MNTNEVTNSHHKEFDDDFLEWEERDNSVPYLTHCIAGSIAGITEHVTMLPCDTVKTHMQVFEGKYTAIETAKKLYRSEGLSKFWRGASVLASGCIPAHATYFTVYELSKMKLLSNVHDNGIHPTIYALTGVLATSMHDLILTPFDMLKQRTQLAPNGLTHPSALLRYIVKNEGFLSLYRGYPITLLMNVPQAAVIVSVNESLKVLYKPKNGHNVLSYFLCAGIAGSASAMMTIPLDNIKTRLQTQTFFQDSRRDMEKSRPSIEKRFTPRMGLISMVAGSFLTPKKAFVTVKENPLTVAEPQIKYRDILSTVKTIFREEGFRGFVKGVVPRIVAQAPASAISWTAYEMMKKMLKSPKLHY